MGDSVGGASRGRKPPTDLATFQQLEIRSGRVVRAEPFPEARKPAIKLWVDFGADTGVLQSSAQLTKHYTAEGLVGTDVLGVVNFPPLRIAGFRSECLVLGVLDPEDGGVVLVRPDRPGAEAASTRPVPEGTKGWELA